MSRLGSSCLVVLLCGAPLAAQEAPSNPVEEAAQEAPSSPVEEAVREALQEAAAGRVEEAVARLEELRETGAEDEPVLAALGALYVVVDREQEALEILAPLAEPEDADPGVLYNAGRAAFELGELRRAATYLKRSIDASDTLTPAARALAMVRIRQEAYFRAYLLLREWVVQAPDDSQARAAAAFCAMKLERAPEAERLLATLPQENPLVALIWAGTLLLKDDAWGALALLKPLLQEDASEDLQLDARQIAAEARLAVGEPQAAVELLSVDGPQSPSFALLLSRAHEEAGNPQEAVAALRPLAETILDEETSATLDLAIEEKAAIAFRFGQMLAALGDHEDAAEHLKLAAKLDPSSQLKWETLGASLGALGRTQAAAAVFERASQLEGAEGRLLGTMRLEDDPDDPTGRQLARALRLAQGGAPAEALSLVKREAMLAPPEDPRPQLVAIRLMMFVGQTEAALDSARTLVERFPFNADAYYQSAAVKMALDRDQEAREDFERALQLVPEHLAALNDLAVLEMRQGNLGEARELLERVLALNPDDQVAAANLEQLKLELPQQ